MNTDIARRRAKPAATTLAVLTCTVIAALAPQPAVAEAREAARVRALNGEVLVLQSAARRGSDRATAGADARQKLEERAAALRALMATDPTAASHLAFPASVLESLAASFPEATGSLEQRGQWSGELEYLVEDSVDLKSHRNVFRLHRGSEVLEVQFAGREPPGLRSGQRLKLGGVRSGRTVVASSVEVMDAAQDGSATAATTAAYPATCATTGPQSSLTVLVNLPSYPLPASVTTEAVKGMLLGNAYSSVQNTPNWSVDDFWRQNSDGQTFLDPGNTTVIGPVAMASNYNTSSTGGSYCDYYGLQDALIKAIDGQVDFRRYARVQIVMPNNGACTWAGVANLGCRSMSSAGDGSFNASFAWLRADQMGSRKNGVMLKTHEMGHNLTLSHAASRDHGAEALGSLTTAGTLSEYGDPHSTMGSWNLGFYSAPHAANQLRWLGLGSNYQVVESSGTYTIQNFEGRPAGLKALKVRRGTGNDAWLWIESRQGTGLYSSQLNSSLFNGALIHYQDSSTGSKTHLPDFTPGTASFSDSALPVGQTWTDPYSNVSVTVSGVTPTATTVTVNYSGVTCASAPPTVTASPTSVATEYGSSANFTVAVKNNSSAGCAADTFRLTSTVPNGWSTAFGSETLTVSPGQQAQTTLTVGVPAPYALGTYAVTGVATSMTGASASDTESVTVVEPANTLTVAVSGSGSVTWSTPDKTCTSTCSTDYVGTPVVVTLTARPASKMVFSGWTGACSGTSTTCTVNVDGDRSVTATFKRASGKR